MTVGWRFWREITKGGIPFLSLRSIFLKMLWQSIEPHNITRNNRTSSLRENPQDFRGVRCVATHPYLQIHIKINPCVARIASRSASWCIKREKRRQKCLRSLYKKRELARTLPKSEKVAAFLCVGERGGVQPFLRKIAII